MSIGRITRGDDRARRKQLHRENPHCAWCGILTIMPKDCAGEQPPDMATVDHIKPKMECRTQDEYRETANRVLACLSCNHRRDSIQRYEVLAPNRRRIPLFAMRIAVPSELSRAFEEAVA